MTSKKGSFRERLLRELARNKAKTAALGVLCLVACYFWLPLFAKLWKKESGSPKSQDTAVVEASVVANPAPSTANAATPDFDWKEFLAWRANEPRMTLLTISHNSRDPFRLPESWQLPRDTDGSEGPEESSLSEAEQSAPIRTPADYGMVLRGTFVGGRASSANINGINYRLGSIVPLVTGDVSGVPETAGDGFRLREVNPHYVVLERNGHEFQLELPVNDGTANTIDIRSVSQ